MPTRCPRWTQSQTLWAAMKKDLDAITGSSKNLFAAQSAAAAMTNGSGKMLEDSKKLFDAFSAFGSVRDTRLFPNFWLGIVSGIAALVSIIGLLWSLYRNRQREQEMRYQTQVEYNSRNQQAIMRLLDEISSLGEGDLTVKATVTEDMTGAIADAINYAVDELRHLVTTINDTTVQVAASTQETQATALQLAEAAGHQSDQINSASERINEIAVSIDQVSRNSTESAEVAQRSVQIATEGAGVVRETIRGMDQIRDQIQETSKRIKRLGESSQEIGSVVELINDISEQTNILALNAAVQAASAGEAGRGFAVVADEVQRLAERTSGATRRIESLVQTIQADTNEAVSSMEQTTSEVVSGARLAEDAGTALGEIERVSNDLNEPHQEHLRRRPEAVRRGDRHHPDHGRDPPDHLADLAGRGADGRIHRPPDRTGGGPAPLGRRLQVAGLRAGRTRMEVSNSRAATVARLRAAVAREHADERAARCDEPCRARLGEARAGRNPAPGAGRSGVLRRRRPPTPRRMHFCAGYLHQVQGTLRMVELYAPAMVAEELELLARALQESTTVDQDEACGTLMRGTVLLPDYLERLQGGHRDIPIVLLPLLNDIRAARGAPGLSESVLFAPDLEQPLPQEVPLPEVLSWQARQARVGEAQEQLDQALAAWPEEGAPADAGALGRAVNRLLESVEHIATRRMLWVASSVSRSPARRRIAAFAGTASGLCRGQPRGARPSRKAAPAPPRPARNRPASCCTWWPSRRSGMRRWTSCAKPSRWTPNRPAKPNRPCARQRQRAQPRAARHRRQRGQGRTAAHQGCAGPAPAHRRRSAARCRPRSTNWATSPTPWA